MPAAKTKRTRTKRTAKKGAARKRAAPSLSLPDALARAAWTEADAALAQALVEFDAAENAADDAARADALALLGQALSRAARKRGLVRIGALGAREAYDPARHDLDSAVAKKTKTVLIQARGVARGDDVLVRPRAGPVLRKIVLRKKRS